MLPIEELASAIRASRDEFGRLFWQAQIDHVPEAARRREFVAVSRDFSADKEAFDAALRYAQVNGWLEPLVHAIVDESREDGRIARALITEQADAGDAELQAISNVAAGLPQPELAYRGYASVRHWTVKILIDGAAAGTGVLIGPNLVLTAWHVVRPLFLPSPGGGWRADPDPATGSRLQAEFDDYLTFVRTARMLAPNASSKIKAHKQWCVVFSRCHDDELQSRLPADLTQLEGQWDYAVIRLAKAPGQERRWAPLDARAAVPRPNSPIVLFQHPAGLPMRLGHGPILKRDGNAAIPRLRFLHGANTQQGSSGGPCFDTGFMLFGIHQGVWEGVQENGQPINRGMPLARVLEDLKAQIPELPAPDPSDVSIWHLGGTQKERAHRYAPVIGCDAFQTLVWRSAIAGKPKIIRITGDRARSGKTFRLSVLSAMLPDADHLKILLPAEQISKMGAPRLAEVICQNAGAPPPAIVPVGEFNATSTAWLKDEVTRKTIGALDAVRNGRLVWLLLSDLNKSEIQGENASAFLLMLYEQVATADWLRVVLDGSTVDVPATVKLFSDFDRVQEITRQDITLYLRRALAELELVDEAGIAVNAKQIERAFNDARDADQTTAMTVLADKAKSVVDDYFEVVAPEDEDN